MPMPKQSDPIKEQSKPQEIQFRLASNPLPKKEVRYSTAVNSPTQCVPQHTSSTFYNWFCSTALASHSTG